MVRCVCNCCGHWNPVKSLWKEGGHSTKPSHTRECGRPSQVTGLPGGLAALHPWTECLLCRSRRPVVGSTLPRQRCSLAGLQAVTLRQGLPEGLLGLEWRKESMSML